MAISYPITFPASPRPRNAVLRAVSNVGVGTSQFSFVTQKQVNSGQRWELDLDFPPMTKAEAGEWIAFLLKLNGQEGTVNVPDPDRTSLEGVGTGTPLIDGASQSGNSLETKGWSNSITDIVKAGDMIQIGSYMYMILNDANSDGSGDATLDIWPNLRSSPADNATITVANVTTLMRLASNEMSWSTDSLQNYGLSLVFVEELPNS